MNSVLGVDTGGTFTDFVLFEAGKLRIHKVLSTPKSPEKAILQGIEELGLNALDEHLTVIHGSTVATNAVLEGKGVRTVYITNHGLADILTIGRQARRELYNLQPLPIPPPVPRELCLETGGRLGANGEVVEDLTEQDLLILKIKLQELAPQSVAINLLFSFLDEKFERRIEALIETEINRSLATNSTPTPDIFVSRSSKILPECKEYERGMATWLNASVGPIVAGYLQRLSQGLAASRPTSKNGSTNISVMQSSGGTINAAQAAEHAVNMLLSGPAGGLAGAQFVANACGHQRLLTFDMGGTSTDVALIDGELQLTTEGGIAGYPVAIPMVDMHTIGAGGGSLASVDTGGLLNVGPGSAGADPGPACYGKGGKLPTVSDANLVLGRLQADAFLGGKMVLDTDAARAAMLPLASSLNLKIEEVALGIIRVVDEHMVRALRIMSVQRGVDPRQLTLVSFGGAGGLHVCALATALEMPRALVPIHAGVLSALGMLVAPKARHLSQSINRELGDLTPQFLEKVFSDMATSGLGSLQDEDVIATEVEQTRLVDLRYRGQSYSLTLPWTGVNESHLAFHNLHEKRYGHRLDLPVEMSTARVKLTASSIPVTLASTEPFKRSTSQVSTVRLVGHKEMVRVYPRSELLPGQRIQGPALVTETVATSYIADNWLCESDEFGNLLLTKFNSAFR